MNAIPNPYATYAPQLGAELWRLAVQWSWLGSTCEFTQAERVDAIQRLRPDLSQSHAAEMDRIIRRAIDDICAARAPRYRIGRRYFARHGKRLPPDIWSRPRGTKRPWHLGPKPNRSITSHEHHAETSDLSNTR